MRNITVRTPDGKEVTFQASSQGKRMDAGSLTEQAIHYADKLLGIKRKPCPDCKKRKKSLGRFEWGMTI